MVNRLAFSTDALALALWNQPWMMRQIGMFWILFWKISASIRPTIYLLSLLKSQYRTNILLSSILHEHTMVVHALLSGLILTYAWFFVTNNQPFGGLVDGHSDRQPARLYEYYFILPL